MWKLESPSLQWWEFSEIFLHLHCLNPTRIHSTALNIIYILFYWIKMCRIVRPMVKKRKTKKAYDYRIECMCYKT